MRPSECDWHKIQVVTLRRHGRVTEILMRPTKSAAQWIFRNITAGELPGYHNWLSVALTREPDFHPHCPECNDQLGGAEYQQMLDKPGARWQMVCRACAGSLHRDTYLLDISGDPSDDKLEL
jgi:hypothetical protein